MKQLRRHLLLFVLTIVTGYLPRFVFQYTTLISETVPKSLGQLSDYEIQNSGETKSDGEFELRRTYKIPMTVVLQDRSEPSLSLNHLGLGIILHKTKLACSPTGSTFRTFNDEGKTLRSIDALKIYLTLPVTEIPCNRNQDLFVTAWVPKTLKRAGYTEGRLLIGDPSAIKTYKKLIEFFNIDLILNALIIIAISMLFDKLVLSTLPFKSRTPFKSILPFLMTFAFFSSGLADSFFPFLGHNLLTVKIQNSIYLTTVLLFTAFYFTQANKKPLSKYSSISIAISVFIFSILLSNTSYVWTSITVFPLICASCLLVMAAKRRDYTVLFSALALVSDSFKILNVSWLPASLLFLYYNIFINLDTFAIELRNASSFLGRIKWARRLSETGKLTLQEFSNILYKEFGIKQRTFIFPESSGACKIVIYKEQAEEIFYRELIPPVFAHIFSTRETLWHVEDNSSLASNIKKGVRSEFRYLGEYFSAIPLFSNNSPVGGIAVTDYNSDLVKNPTKRLEFFATLDLLKPLITELFYIEHQHTSSTWFEQCNEVAEKIAKLPITSDINNDFKSVTDLITEMFQCSGFLSVLELGTRRVVTRSVSGHTAATEKKYFETQFYAVAANEQGPMPLAINKNKVVFVSDLGWIRQVLHPSTVELFENCGINSCAAIPLRATTDESPWGILWLESKEKGFFSSHSELTLNLISSAITGLKDRIEMHTKNRATTTALAGFVPERILSKLLAGESPKEEDHGYLLMADLKSSTRISRTVGANKWVEFTHNLRIPVEEIARDYGFTLQSLVWDAFYFTKTQTAPESGDLSNLIEMSERLSELFNRAGKKEFDRALFNGVSEPARFCITFGDVTRDLKFGITQNWAIVGHAMAAVAKLEQTCKSYSGWFYIDSLASHQTPSDFDVLDKPVPGTDAEIYRYREKLEFNDDSQPEEYFEPKKKAA